MQFTLGPNVRAGKGRELIARIPADTQEWSWAQELKTKTGASNNDILRVGIQVLYSILVLGQRVGPENFGIQPKDQDQDQDQNAQNG